MKSLSIYYAVKRTITQKFNPRRRAISAKYNYMRTSIPLLSQYAATGISAKRADPIAM